MATLPAPLARASATLVERARAADSAAGVFSAASQRLRALFDFDAAVWLATDPATGLPTAPTRVETMDDIGQSACLSLWEQEHFVEDVNLYRDLAGSSVPAGGLRLATADRPARSPRYRSFLRPTAPATSCGACLRAGGRRNLFRVDGKPRSAKPTEG